LTCIVFFAIGVWAAFLFNVLAGASNDINLIDLNNEITQVEGFSSLFISKMHDGEWYVSLDIEVDGRNTDFTVISDEIIPAIKESIAKASKFKRCMEG